MKQATKPLYIRFGEIPKNENSKVHRGDAEIRNEGGVSVFKAIETEGKYYPILPKHPNDNAITDYFYLLLHSNTKVYLVTGDEIFIEGADREPLLMNVKVIKEITDNYNRPKAKKKKLKILFHNARELIKNKQYDKEVVLIGIIDQILGISGLSGKYYDKFKKYYFKEMAKEDKKNDERKN